MADVLILYATTDGHTPTICARIESTLAERGHRVTVADINAPLSAPLDHHDLVVIGASIRYGKHGKAVYAFIREHHEALDRVPNAFFSVNVVARKPEKNRPETNPYLKKFLRQIPWKPRRLDVFAGRLEFPRYSFFDRTMIRFIMWMTKGPTAPDTVVEFTDWDRVAAFAEGLCEDLETAT